MADDGEQLLRRYRSDVHSLCAAFPEPVSAHKINMEFKDNFDEEVPFRRFGYMAFEAFLEDHPDLQKVFIDGRYCYRANLTAATMEIQSLIAKQKKNKKKRNGKKEGRGGKGNTTRPFMPRNVASNYLPQRMGRGGKTVVSFYHLANTFGSPFGRPGSSGRNNTTNTWDIQPLVKAASSTSLRGVDNTLKNQQIVPNISLPNAESNPVEAAKIGATRILQALNKCSGKATLTKLNWAYQDLFKTQFDYKEMSNFFGTKNMRKVHQLYLADKIELITGCGDQWSFLSKENALKQKEWEQRHKSSIITETKKSNWVFPTVKELYDKLIDMLLNMYPETIPLDHIDEIYKRAYNVKVNTTVLYSKTWEDLVKTTFTDGLRLTQDNRITLTPKFINALNLNQQQKSLPQKESKVKRVTATDLGLEYSEDDEDEDEGDSSGSAASSSFDDYSALKNNLTKQTADLKSKNLINKLPPGLAPSSLAPPGFVPPGTKPNKLILIESVPKEAKADLFKHSSNPIEDTTRISNETLESISSASTSASGQSNAKRYISPAIFAPFAKHINRPVASTSTQSGQLQSDIEKNLALSQRINSMDILLQMASEQEKKMKLKPMTYLEFRGSTSDSGDDKPTTRGSSLFLNNQSKRNNSPFIFPQTEPQISKIQARVSPFTTTPDNLKIRPHGRSQLIKDIIKDKKNTK